MTALGKYGFREMMKKMSKQITFVERFEALDTRVRRIEAELGLAEAQVRLSEEDITDMSEDDEAKSKWVIAAYHHLSKTRKPKYFLANEEDVLFWETQVDLADHFSSQEGAQLASNIGNLPKLKGGFKIMVMEIDS